MASSTSQDYPQSYEIDVQECVLYASMHFKWVGCSGGIAMDVGCGTESTKRIATMCRDLQKIIAIDSMPSRIELAKQFNSNPKIEYRVANIEDSSTLTEWTGTITKLLSVNYFTHVNDQTAAFKNVYNLLAPGGEAAIQFCLQSYWFDTYMDLFQQARWKDQLRNLVNLPNATFVPESHTKKYDASHYLKMLKEIGFQVVVCQEEDKTYIFESEAACRHDITDIQLVDLIGSDQKEEFKQTIFDTFINISESSREYPRLNYKALLVLVRKLKTLL